MESDLPAPAAHTDVYRVRIERKPGILGRQHDRRLLIV
jgi:hypothetical protein